MGSACLKGWLASDQGNAKTLSSDSFVCVVPTDEHREELRREFGVECVKSISDIESSQSFDLVLLAVKPQVLPEVLEELAESPVLKKRVEEAGCSSEAGPCESAINDRPSTPVVLSIAAGISTKDIEDSLPEGMHVVRAMPNMPLQVRHGATAVCSGRSATDDEVDAINGLFSSLGTSCVVEEDQIDAVCAISGGGPAYVAYMIEALRDAGAKLGLEPSLAEMLAFETLGGTYEAMKLQGTAPEKMRESVCSPGGTTLAALASLDSSGFVQMYGDAMDAAVRRAKELRERK